MEGIQRNMAGPSACLDNFQYTLKVQGKEGFWTLDAPDFLPVCLQDSSARHNA